MAAKRRHWKEKDGRFWARIAIPKDLQPFFEGKTQLSEPLGGDRRVADRNHAAAVARLQERIAEARRLRYPAPTPAAPTPPRQPLNQEMLAESAWTHYTSRLEEDDRFRASLPSFEEINAEYERLMQRIDAGEFDAGRDPISMINGQTDYELLRSAREHYQRNRSRRLAALRSGYAQGDTRLVDASVKELIDTKQLTVEPGSADWRALADGIMRAEIEALERTLERDVGNHGGQPSDPIITAPEQKAVTGTPAPLMTLFGDYIIRRQMIGKHRDAGANWTHAIKDLIKFLGHDDASRITKRNLLDWRDALLSAGKSPKTVANKHLAAIRAVLKWAYENERLPTNEAATVKQEVPRKVQMRERGYTTPEAVRILKASLTYQPVEAANPSNRESAHVTAAKRWVPLLCAFTGARTTELTQLRKEDLRLEGSRWILRITPEAGSVKTGQFRDVPLHRQVVALGFTEFVEAAPAGPLFHRAKTMDKYLVGARTTSGRLSAWLNERGLVPDGVQPLYGWRHRFKTLGRELGASDRVLDAIQGHSGKTASDGYGDVTIAARLKVIDALPDYDLSDSDTGEYPDTKHAQIAQEAPSC